MSQITDILAKQIAVADAMLPKVAAIPNGQPSPHLFGYIRYDASFTRPLSQDADAWETETLEILRAIYGESARQVIDFKDCTRDKSNYFKFREELQAELKRCIVFLKALIKVDEMKQELAAEQPGEKSNKTPCLLAILQRIRPLQKRWLCFWKI